MFFRLKTPRAKNILTISAFESNPSSNIYKNKYILKRESMHAGDLFSRMEFE